MPRLNAPTPIVAYASMVTSNPNHKCDLKLLRRWCSRVPGQMDILAEEIHPTDDHRPLWSEILALIERGAITTLVVPSLFHVAGDDFVALSKFLVFLKARGVTLKSLTEVIDSRRASQHEIILKLVEDYGNTSPIRGAQ